MIFEMPIDHFPSKTSSTISRNETRSSLPLRLPFSSASCLEISKAVQEEPTVTRTTFNFGKSASVSCLVKAASMTKLPRLSLSVAPIDRPETPEPTRKLSLCERFANTLTIPSVIS